MHCWTHWSIALPPPPPYAALADAVSLGAQLAVSYDDAPA